jgi:uncharacterized RDD family membrane protein YckC
MIVRCPDCGGKGRLRDEFAGRSMLCPHCGGKFVATEEVAVQPGVKWYYAAGQEKLGPVGQSEFERLVAGGIISPGTLVWRKGMAGWLPLTEARGLERNQAVAREELPFFQAEDVGSSTASGRRPPKTVSGKTDLVYAGGGKRLAAKIIDLIFMFTMASMVEGLSRKLFPGAYASVEISPVYAVTMVLNMLLGIFYITWFIGKFGATPGKMVFNLKVVTPTGGKVGYGQAFGRYCGEFIVIWLTLLLGYLPILFDSQKRGLHDRLCGTRVVVV